MSKYKPVIVVVAYNRAHSLKRLLGSLELASYNTKDIRLIISIDKGVDNQDVVKVAESFCWKYGEKEVRYQDNNLGLRNHVLKCGDLTQEYGSIIMLEDDLYVAPDFYNYTLQALEFTKNDFSVGGISLYKHEINMCTYKAFNPIEDGYDNWYFQYAASWGQAWSAIHWKSFKEWYDKGQNLKGNLSIPRYVRSWSEKSWLKYNIAYLIEKNKYFLYPKIALSTNFSDVGTHVGNTSTAYQVPLFMMKSKTYKFSTVEESLSVYDAFYENAKLYMYLNKGKEDLVVDLYGHKEYYGNKYLLTDKIMNYKILNSFSRLLKPIEMNVVNNIKGEELFLYDVNFKEINSRSFNNLNSVFIVLNTFLLKILLKFINI
ncbi:glycosyltransferase [Cellulophaga lytica]|uniref:glycosyltransferase n=1 Tax=Cellulophaga lytica TaxID=979 RepID=UPI0032E3971B